MGALKKRNSFVKRLRQRSEFEIMFLNCRPMAEGEMLRFAGWAGGGVLY